MSTCRFNTWLACLASSQLDTSESLNSRVHSALQLCYRAAAKKGCSFVQQLILVGQLGFVTAHIFGLSGPGRVHPDADSALAPPLGQEEQAGMALAA